MYVPFIGKPCIEVLRRQWQWGEGAAFGFVMIKGRL